MQRMAKKLVKASENISTANLIFINELAKAEKLEKRWINGSECRLRTWEEPKGHMLFVGMQRNPRRFGGLEIGTLYSQVRRLQFSLMGYLAPLASWLKHGPAQAKSHGTAQCLRINLWHEGDDQTLVVVVVSFGKWNSSSFLWLRARDRCWNGAVSGCLLVSLLHKLG